MSKAVSLAFTAMLLILVAKPESDRFSKYKVVEAYEIRPGILMMPRYAEDGQICEIGLEKRHYTPELIDLDATLSRKEIDQLTDELVPVSERGPKSTDFPGGSLIDEAGPGMTTTSMYENVTISITSHVISTSRRHGTVVDDVAVTIKWNKRKCQ